MTETRETETMVSPASYKDTISIIRAPSSWPNHLTKAPSANIIKLEIKVLTYERGRTGAHIHILARILVRTSESHGCEPVIFPLLQIQPLVRDELVNEYGLL